VPRNWLIAFFVALAGIFTIVVISRAATPATPLQRAEALVVSTGQLEAAAAAAHAEAVALRDAIKAGEPPPKEEPPPSSMVVALNGGGWGPAEWTDIAGAVKYSRMGKGKLAESEVDAMAKAGVSASSVIFGEGGSIGGINPGAYAGEIVAFFKKYGRGGTFWAGRPDLGARNVEVLNEPGGSWFWSDSTNYSAYVNLLKVVHEQLVANFPEAIRPVELASYDGGKADSNKFGQEIKSRGGLAYVDGITEHPYGGSGGQYGGAKGNRGKVEQAHTETGKPMYITEVGWPTAVGHPSTGDSQQWTEAQQAANIEGFIAWAKATGYVSEVAIFGYVDDAPTTNNWYGVERRDRTHKPAFAVLTAASG
jgi:hypothetical protein